MLNPSNFAILRDLLAHYPTFRREAERISRDDYVLWPLREAYCGEWRVFPFFMCSYPPELERRFAPNQARCPETVDVLRRYPQIWTAAYSRLEPGCHIYPHRDHAIDGVLRAHIGLMTPGGSKMRIEEQIVQWQQGRAIVFDGQRNHEAANTGESPRTVLMVDFKVAGRERALAFAHRDDVRCAQGT